MAPSKEMTRHDVDNPVRARRAIEQVCSGRDLASAPELYDERFVDHINGMTFEGLAGIRDSVGMYRAIFSDLRFEVDEQVSEADRMAVPAAWRSYLLGAAAVLGLYGLGLLIAPDTLTDFWPWPVDDFHARLYSAIFLTLAVAGLTVSRVAAPVELLLVGLTQLTLGFFSILGLVLADVSENAVDWSALGTWVWVGGFGIIMVAGAALVARAQDAPLAAPAGL